MSKNRRGQKRRDRTVSAGTGQTPEERPSSIADSAQRPIVRRKVVLFGLAVLAITAGYYSGQFARAALKSRAADVGLTSAEQQTVVPDIATNPTPAVTIDPDAPLPATAGELMQEANSITDDLLKCFPDNVDILEVKARAQVWLGNAAEAVKTWQACLELDPKYVHAYVGMASAAAERSEHEQAAELAQQAIDLAPQSFQAREILASVLLQLGRSDEVPGVIEKFLETDPRSRGFFLLGQAYSQMKQFDKAVAPYEAAIRIYPEYTEAYNGLAIAYARTENKDKAKQTQEKFRDLASPEKSAKKIRGATDSDLTLMCRAAAVLYSDAGRVCYVNKQELEAELLWLRATVLDPRNKDCRQSLAWLCRNAKRPGENIYWLQQLAKLEPTNPTYWIEIGRNYDDLFLLPAAEKAFRKALEIAPQNDVGHSAVAELLVRYKKDLPEAQELASKAVELQPSAANYVILSVACRSNNDLSGALAAIEKALKLAPRNATYRAIRASILAEQ